MQNTNHIETKTNTASRQWLVAYVQSCLEKKTAQRLAAMGIECYLPVQSEIRQWSDRRKRVDRLVIPMMIFVHVTPQERPLPLSLQAVSRYMVLRGESTPAVIPDEQMDRFRFHARLQPRSGGNVQRPTGSRRCRESNKRAACRTRRGAYHCEREK